MFTGRFLWLIDIHLSVCIQFDVISLLATSEAVKRVTFAYQPNRFHTVSPPHYTFSFYPIPSFLCSCAIQWDTQYWVIFWPLFWNSPFLKPLMRHLVLFKRHGIEYSHEIKFTYL